MNISEIDKANKLLIKLNAALSEQNKIIEDIADLVTKYAEEIQEEIDKLKKGKS